MANEDATTLVELTEGLSLKDLLSGDGATFQIDCDGLGNVDEFYSCNEPVILDFGHLSQEFCDAEDEDGYDKTESFDKLATKMTSLLSNGKIKKHIVKEGIGTGVPEDSSVTIHYNAYVEYGDEPFDSTYARKKPLTFMLNNGEALPGLNYGVSTMKLHEKAQFLIHHEYAYGKLGCPPRIPPEATVLFEVEIKNCVDAGFYLKYPHLNDDKQHDFKEIYKYCLALCDSAKELFKKGRIRQATKDYNVAVNKLEYCNLPDYQSQEKQQELLFRLYKNLVICNTKIEKPKRACTSYNNLCKMCKGTSFKIPAKIYYQHARALMMLGEYDFAEKDLRRAQCMEPQSKEISRELKNLALKRKEKHEREIQLAKALCNYKKFSEVNSEITSDFKSAVTSNKM